MKIIMQLSFSILLSFSLPVYAIEGVEIMEKVLNVVFYQGDSQRAQAHMRIIDKQGRARIRDLIMLRRNIGTNTGKQKYYIYFKKPSDIKKMVFMAWKNEKKDDDRWLYLPALDLVKRIAASDERTSFVGSHFYYEDISGRGLNEDNHVLIKEDDLMYLIRSKPKNIADVEFSSYQVTVDKKTFLPLKIEYFESEKTVAYRIYETLEFEAISGFTTITKSKMQDTRTHGYTIVEYSDIRYSQDIPEKIFSERYLRKAPKRYLN